MRITISILLSVTALGTAPATLLSGCATSPIELTRTDLQASAAASRRPRSPVLPLILVGPVEDRRWFIGGRSVPPAPAEEGASGGAGTTWENAAGGLGGRTVSMAGLPEEVHAELVNLSSPGFDVVGEEEAAAGPASLVLHPRLLKAYLSALDVSMTAVVVIEIEYLAADGTRSTRAYRGQHSSMNWASAKGEARFSMRRALEACLEQVRADLERRVKPA